MKLWCRAPSILIIRQWFLDRFDRPTDVQQRGWPELLAGYDALLAAPTGSGKTLAAFLVSIDRLVRDGLSDQLPDQVQVVYVSPLRALSNDMQHNLQTPLAEICALADRQGLCLPPLRASLRTGDTSQADRQAMVRRPPHIVVTTPESLYLLLTGSRSREMLTSVHTVIVDEIHALARDKRGTHLALSLERLDALRTGDGTSGDRPQRIGLSATQRPIHEIGRFLVGAANRSCRIIDVGHVRQLDLRIEVPSAELSAVCSNDTWTQIHDRLAQLIREHRSTLVFVNTRRLAERVTHQLTDLLDEDAVASHHGSLAQRIRHSTEARLKAGELKAVVATASLELGIDVGHIDLVCQIGTPDPSPRFCNASAVAAMPLASRRRVVCLP